MVCGKRKKKSEPIFKFVRGIYLAGGWMLAAFHLMVRLEIPSTVRIRSDCDVNDVSVSLFWYVSGLVRCENVLGAETSSFKQAHNCICTRREDLAVICEWERVRVVTRIDRRDEEREERKTTRLGTKPLIPTVLSRTFAAHITARKETRPLRYSNHSIARYRRTSKYFLIKIIQSKNYTFRQYSTFPHGILFFNLYTTRVLLKSIIFHPSIPSRTRQTNRASTSPAIVPSSSSNVNKTDVHFFTYNLITARNNEAHASSGFNWLKFIRDVLIPLQIFVITKALYPTCVTLDKDTKSTMKYTQLVPAKIISRPRKILPRILTGIRSSRYTLFKIQK